MWSLHTIEYNPPTCTLKQLLLCFTNQRKICQAVKTELAAAAAAIVIVAVVIVAAVVVVVNTPKIFLCPSILLL